MLDDEEDPQEAVYHSIAQELFERYPDARWGPGHVVLEDGNWGAYESAIEITLITLAWRALAELDLEDLANEMQFHPTPNLYNLNVAEGAAWYHDHSIAELGATLGALKLIRWHEQGHKGEAPKE